ncbi:hypothetical protein DFJ58DRAFT_736947 [Suillus subalutaceus]|uniref:uncharacterized protein n=1 Tax=Suillus subalutaceus TaxID=48586 RepID=UPI001B8672F3|nr:uncharacterized protein DFJ58DRAFT_736947 [Suillus subalutaceus]KAG1830491.1 hypothetical protein DFJ58DRAFT_736947 [Suillus subalutaceus]
MQSFMDFCREEKIYEKVEDVKLPTAGGLPIQLVEDPSDGLACTESADCTHAVRDLATMHRHGREKHNTTSFVDIQYRSCQVQQIFTVLHNSYFEVCQDVIRGVRPDIRATLEATFLPQNDVALIGPTETEQWRTPLVHFMDWDKFQVELWMNPIQRLAADDIKKRHTSEESGGILTRLAATVRDHMTRASTILDGHPHRLSLSKLLLYGNSIPRETDSYWRPVSDDNVDYPNFMVQLMRAIVRIHLGSPLEFSFALSTVQTTCLEELLVVLRNDNTSPRRRMIAYHNLAWSLVDTDPDLCVVDRWANPIKRAIWLRALRADGNFCEASFLTPDLAKLKYFCNITSLLEALMDKDEDADAVHFDDHDRVIRIHERVLRLGRTTTFNIVYEMQQYASSVVFNQTREPNVYVDPDVKSITIGTNTMHMDMLRDGIQRLLLELKSRYSALTNDNVVLKEVPEQVKDDLTNSTRGYSLASEEPFYKKRHALFLYLVDHYDLAMVDNAGRVAWNIPGIKELLRRSFRVWEPLYHLLYITTHISCRGTQFIDHKVSNADRHRNLFMQGNEMFLLTGYSKKTGITDRDSCTPGFVPKEVAFWALELLAGGLRTAEAILAGVAFGPQAEHVYRTYLCVGEGERISPTMFSANIQQWNNEYFQCRWGVRDFRQGAITMGREFIATDDSSDDADNILAESPDHDTAMDHSFHSVVHGLVPRLSNNIMCKHRWLGDQWHSVLGLGPFPPPEAVRLSRKQLANGTFLQSISDQVKKATEETLKSFFSGQYTEILKDAVCAAIIQQNKDERDARPMRRMPESLLCSSWAAQSSMSSGCLDNVFQDQNDGNPSALSPSHGPSRYIHDRNVAAAGMLCANSSSHISRGNMVMDSPLPASSIQTISHTESMDESILFDRKGKGRAYGPGQRKSSKANVAYSTRNRMADSDMIHESPSLSPIAVRPDNRRVFELSQRRKYNRKVDASGPNGSSASIVSSSISPIADRKAKCRTFEPCNPRLFQAAVNTSKRRDAVHSVSHDEDSVTYTSRSAAVASTVYRSRKRQIRDVSEADTGDDTCRRPKRFRSHGDADPNLVMEVISLSSDDDLSCLEENQSLKSLRQPVTSIEKTSQEDLSVSSADDLSGVDNNIPLQRLRQPIKQVATEVINVQSEDDMSSVYENQPLKRLRRTRTSVKNVYVDVTRPSSNDSMSNFIVDDGSRPSSPPSAVRDIREEIRRAIRHIRRDDTAREKSSAQMNVLIAVMTAATDLVVTMKTGGGKSMSWMVPSVMDEESRSIVVCPFVALLEEQYKNTAASGLRCHNYCISKTVPEDVQILFVQVEHCSSIAFANLLVSALGQKFNRFFVDEFHDISTSHPGRIVPWKQLAQQFGKMRIMIILMTATGPPCRIASFIKPFGMKRNLITEVRSSTNRPEIGMHVVHLQPIAAMQSLRHLVAALSKRLAAEERILVFCNSQGDAEGFSLQAKCAVYHSDLWQAGNTKAYNLNLWDEGETKVMACTTAFAQGMDRPHVRYVVIFKPSFGLIVNNQMLGRAGRDGKESHVFFLLTRGSIATPLGMPEGAGLPMMTSNPLLRGRIQASHQMYAEFVPASALLHPEITAPIPSQPKSPSSDDLYDHGSSELMSSEVLMLDSMEDKQVSVSGSGVTQATQNIPIECAPASPLLQSVSLDIMLILKLCPQTLDPQMAMPDQLQTQSSDALYDQGTSDLTSFEALMLDAMEKLHAPRTTGLSSGHYATTSQPSAISSSFVRLMPPSSLPSDSRTFSAKASRVDNGLLSRLSRSSRLDKFMRVLRDKCPVHFGNVAVLVPEANHRCTVEGSVPMHLYREFKLSFSFERYSYCFQCCLPQSQNGNGEEPACHAGFSYKPGDKCPFAGFIFKAVFSMWHREGFRKLMIQDIGSGELLATYPQFLTWIVQESSDEGKYINLIEVFLWFCSELEKAKPKFFA